MSLFSFPDQTIAETLKDENWHKEHASNFVAYSLTDGYNDQRKEILKLYRAYNAELSEEELELTKAITCPHGFDLGTEYVVYPLIQSKIEQIIGEFIQRPLRRKAYVVDKKSKNKKFDQKLQMMAEQMMQEVNKNMEADLGFKPETQNPDMEIPENIEEHDFKTIAEEVADSILNIFLDVRKEKSKFKQLFTDYCISDRAHAVLDKKHGFTTARKVHPLDATHDIDPYKVVQNDHEFFIENYYLTENEIYNTFPDLTKFQKEEVRKTFDSLDSLNVNNSQSEELSTSKMAHGWFQTSNKTFRMRLVSMMWKSRKRVSIKVSKGKDDKTFYKKVKEEEIRSKDKVENIDGEMPRFVIMLGPELVLDWGVMDKRYSHIDDPYSCQLPVISIIRDNTIGTSLIKSVAAKLYQLQQIASEVLFEIRIALKSAGDSRVLTYDAAMTPKEFSVGSYENGLNRVLHHIKKDKFMVYNSKQKGTPTNSKPFDSLDLSQKGAIQDLFNGLAIIEDLASKFVGISPEREGTVGQYQTATGTDKAIRGSLARTEVIFTPFDEFIQGLLEKVILKAKQDYEKGEVIHYIFGEMKTKFLTMFEDFFLADYGLYLSDARKDKEASDRIDRAAEMALSNANAPEMALGLIDVFEGESASDKKKIFQKMLDSMEKIRQESAKAAQAAEEAKLASEKAVRDQNMIKAREGNVTEKEVATIYANSKNIDGVMKATSAERIKAAELEVKREENKEKNRN